MITSTYSLLTRALFLQCFDTVGWVIWPVKKPSPDNPDMAYNVFGGTLKTLLNQRSIQRRLYMGLVSCVSNSRVTLFSERQSGNVVRCVQRIVGRDHRQVSDECERSATLCRPWRLLDDSHMHRWTTFWYDSLVDIYSFIAAFWRSASIRSTFWPRNAVKRCTCYRKVCPCVCLFVCLSHSWVTPKRFKISKYALNHTIKGCF